MGKKLTMHIYEDEDNYYEPHERTESKKKNSKL